MSYPFSLAVLRFRYSTLFSGFCHFKKSSELLIDYRTHVRYSTHIRHELCLIRLDGFRADRNKTMSESNQIIECGRCFHWQGTDYQVRTGVVVLLTYENGRKAPYRLDDDEKTLEPIGSGSTAEPMDTDDYRYTHGGLMFRAAVDFANERWA